MATTLKIVAGNTAPNWQITCERDGVAINLNGCTVTVNIENSDGVITRTGGVCTILNSAAGIISYLPTAGDCPEEDTYSIDVKVTYGDLTYEVLYEQLKVKTREPIIPVV